MEQEKPLKTTGLLDSRPINEIEKKICCRPEKRFKEYYKSRSTS